MKRSAFDNTRDQIAADREDFAKGYTPELMCAAQGCPNRWSVDAGQGRCCSAHAWASRGQWPEITQQQQWDETERARQRGESKPAPAMPLTRAEKVEILAQLRGLFTQPRDPKAWAHALQRREAAGERLSDVQRSAWRAAVSPHAVLDWAKDGENVPAHDITRALQLTGDIPWPYRHDVPAFDEVDP